MAKHKRSFFERLTGAVRVDDDLELDEDEMRSAAQTKKDEAKEATEDNFFYRELYWGAFSRSILLPQEIEVEEADAQEKYGLLTIRLPKIDKEKQTKLRVKSGI